MVFLCFLLSLFYQNSSKKILRICEFFCFFQKMCYNSRKKKSGGLFMEQNIQGLFEFIKCSPSCFHVIENARQILSKAGFSELKENTLWSLEYGRDYYVIRNGSSIIAFRMPESNGTGFRIVASHSDSPTFRIKEKPLIQVEKHYTKLNIEKYGGMILNTWFDRPLSVAGRVMVKEGDTIKSVLVNVDRDLLMIPNLAIHMSSGDRKELNPQVELLPLFGTGHKEEAFIELISKEIGSTPEQILSYDLFLYNRMEGTILGENGEFIGAPKLDDLECAYGSIQALMADRHKKQITMCCIFDNEEVGSGTKQGAGSTFLPEVMERIYEVLGKTREEYFIGVSESFVISADNAHAVHPNYTDKTDPSNRTYLNEGIVIKYNAAQRYTTDAQSAAVMKDICNRGGVPYQEFFNRSEMQGGSTLGNILTRQVSMKSVDIGLPQLAMHSSYEMAGSKDFDDMIKVLTAFYRER